GGREVGPSSERLAAGVERGLVASGMTVERVGLVPTPALYFAVAARGLDGGVQITGSHNPPEFNGFKMTSRKRPIFGADIQKMREWIDKRPAGLRLPGASASAGSRGSAQDAPILDAYRAMLVERLASARGLNLV